MGPSTIGKRIKQLRRECDPQMTLPSPARWAVFCV